MKLQLTDTELDKLRDLQRSSTLSRRQYIKVTILVMLHEGLSVEQVRIFLGIDENTVYRHVGRFREVGIQRYMNDNFVAYQGKLSEEQLEQLDEHLQGRVYATVHLICDWIWHTFGVHYTPSGLRPLLHRLGFRYKQTRTFPSKADEQKQQTFLEETLPTLLEEVRAGKAQLYYSDGVHPTHNTVPGRGWIKKGVSVELPANTGRKRVNINAAINAISPTEAVYDLTDRVNAQSTQWLCEQLLDKHPDKQIFVICDNARYNRNRYLTEWLKDKPIELVYLPPYSPNLNLIERLWRHMRQKVLRWEYFSKYEEFRHCIHNFISNLEPYRKDLESLMTLNFRTVGGCSYYYSQTN